MRPIGLKTWELSLEPRDHDGLTYEAGQFAWLNVSSNAFSLRDNPLSLASDPAEGSGLRFVIKELGDFTSTIGKILPGTTAYVDGPHGSLVASDRNEPGIALIAGGVGIAPLLSMLRQLHLESDHRPTMLFYGNRVNEQIVHSQELETLERDHGTQLLHVLSEPLDNWAGHTGLVDKTDWKDILRLTCEGMVVRPLWSGGHDGNR